MKKGKLNKWGYDRLRITSRHSQNSSVSLPPTFLAYTNTFPDLDQPFPCCKEQPSCHHDAGFYSPPELADRNTSPSTKTSLLFINSALIPSDQNISSQSTTSQAGQVNLCAAPEFPQPVSSVPKITVLALKRAGLAF